MKKIKNRSLLKTIAYFDFTKSQNMLEYLWGWGVVVPQFCYHRKLSIVGNCWACLSELELAPKPLTSCTALTTLLTVEKKVFHDSPYAKKKRENTLEMLLINHPLDCPVCDQGGDCDFQDQSLLYGPVKRRFQFIKPVVDDKLLGYTVKTVMTRCIHCTRWVRFFSEISGDCELGTLFWGSATEIGTYVDLKILLSEISGNIIELCPVGHPKFRYKNIAWKKRFKCIKL